MKKYQVTIHFNWSDEFAALVPPHRTYINHLKYSPSFVFWKHSFTIILKTNLTFSKHSKISYSIAFHCYFMLFYHFFTAFFIILWLFFTAFSFFFLCFYLLIHSFYALDTFSVEELSKTEKKKELLIKRSLKKVW